MGKLNLKFHAKKILEQLEKAGPKGLSKSKLGIKGSKSVKSQVLIALEKKGRVDNLGTHRKTRYVLVKHYKPFEIACERVDQNARASGIGRSGTLPLLIQRDLEKGCRGQVRKKVDEAVDWLVREQKLLKLKRGRNLYFLHADLVREVLAEQVEIPTFEIKPEPHSINRGDVFTAYLRVRNRIGDSKVEIYELQQELGAPMDQLKDFLLEESCQGRVVLSRGDGSVSATAARAGAVKLNGQLLVEFKE